MITKTIEKILITIKLFFFLYTVMINIAYLL